MSKSPITTDNELTNPAPGAGLRDDLLVPLGVDVAEVALATGLSTTAIDGFLDGRLRVDADFDLRFGRYFGFSPGYLLRLQIAHDLENAARDAADDLERIRPLKRVAA
jgi:addiction module HigA family antidote